MGNEGEKVGTNSNKYTPTTAGSYTVTISATGYNNKTSNAVTVTGDNVFVVANTEQWNTATTAIKNGGNNKTYDIVVTGSFSIPGYSSNTFGNVTGVTVNIRGAGTITLASGSTGGLLYIRGNQTVSLKDTHLVGHSSNGETLVEVGDYLVGTLATFNMTGGTISGNGGEGVSVNYGTFNMSGGTISGNIGDFAIGVSVYEGGTFNMSGGTISDNINNYSDTTNNYWGGGGVYVGEFATFNMSGTAVIRGNKAQRGGGVFLSAEAEVGVIISENVATFNMSGGTIAGNEATQNGGGVYMQRVGNGGATSQIFNMTGGTISGNKANQSGGGVYKGASSIFRIEKGTIYGSNEPNESLRNTATSNSALYSSSVTASSTAERGTFSGATWTSKGTLATTNDTINVLNGDIVP